MSRPSSGMLARTLSLALLVMMGLLNTAAASASGDDPGVSVKLDQSRLNVGPGEKFSFESTIRNTGDASLDDFVAHLNILSTDEGVYVDPEDWSPKRTQYIDQLGVGQSTTLTWRVQAVTSGPLVLYVSVTSSTTDKVTSSGPLDLTVGGQRIVDAGRVLPLVLWMPAGVFALLAATFLWRRRHR